MDTARSIYWSLSDGDRRELASWRLAAALADRLRVRSVLELHEGGGTYDTLHLALTPEGTSERAVKINRAPAGRVHLIGSRCHPAPEPEDRLARITAGPQLGPSALKHQSLVIAEAYVNPDLSTTAAHDASLTYMADLLERAMRHDARKSWAWRSGTIDSAAAGLHWRDEFFDAVPAIAGIRRGRPEASEQRCWFSLATVYRPWQ